MGKSWKYHDRFSLDLLAGISDDYTSLDRFQELIRTIMFKTVPVALPVALPVMLPELYRKSYLNAIVFSGKVG